MFNNKKKFNDAILFFLIALVIIQFSSCKGEDKSKAITNKQVGFKIETSSDTIYQGEYAKSFAFLEKPFFKNSGMVVYMENDDEYSLKEDLSNEYDVNMEIFVNLRHDTINQKWMKGNDFDKTVVFGKKFDSTGSNTIKGYILEYYNKDLPIDSVFKSKKVKKYYFEKEIYVDSTLE
ncbi:hypothetical protein [Maribacter sp. 2210JD10-5]|uniref:hypothetical protein n=1 Tax=Maribacter sp. 2210JD10-5 TaxID=3386272 RepID=UPI0039BC2630